MGGGASISGGQRGLRGAQGGGVGAVARAVGPPGPWGSGHSAGERVVAPRRCGPASAPGACRDAGGVVLGRGAQPGPTAVEAAVKHVVERAEAAGVATGVSIGASPESVAQWADYVLDWICYGVDVTLMMQCFNNVATHVRSHVDGSAP